MSIRRIDEPPPCCTVTTNPTTTDGTGGVDVGTTTDGAGAGPGAVADAGRDSGEADDARRLDAASLDDRP